MNEIYQYVWDTNAKRDKPLKEHDHVLDSIRYPLYLRYLNSKNNQYQPTQSEQLDDLKDLGLV